MNRNDWTPEEFDVIVAYVGMTYKPTGDMDGYGVMTLSAGNAGDLNKELFLKIETLLIYARQYRNNYNLEDLDTLKLAIQFIRESEYNGSDWNITAGNINYDFINYVKRNDLELYDYFQKGNKIYDGYGNGIDLKHFAATLNALLFTSLTPKGITENYQVLVGDKTIDNLAGWAGDLQTFILYNVLPNVIRNGKQDDYSYAYYCTMQLLGGENTYFSMSDLYADIDSVVINDLLSNEMSFMDALIYHYSEGYKTRYATFFDIQDIHNKAELGGMVHKYSKQTIVPSITWPLYKKTTIPTAVSIGAGNAFTEYMWYLYQNENRGGGIYA